MECAVDGPAGVATEGENGLVEEKVELVLGGVVPGKIAWRGGDTDVPGVLGRRADIDWAW